MKLSSVEVIQLCYVGVWAGQGNKYPRAGSENTSWMKRPVKSVGNDAAWK